MLEWGVAGALERYQSKEFISSHSVKLLTVSTNIPKPITLRCLSRSKKNPNLTTCHSGGLLSFKGHIIKIVKEKNLPQLLPYFLNS